MGNYIDRQNSGGTHRGQSASSNNAADAGNNYTERSQDEGKTGLFSRSDYRISSVFSHLKTRNTPVQRQPLCHHLSIKNAFFVLAAIITIATVVIYVITSYTESALSNQVISDQLNNRQQVIKIMDDVSSRLEAIKANFRAIDSQTSKSFKDLITIQSLTNRTSHFQAIKKSITGTQLKTNASIEAQQNTMREITRGIANMNSVLQQIKSRSRAIESQLNERIKAQMIETQAIGKMMANQTAGLDTMDDELVIVEQDINEFIQGYEIFKTIFPESCRFVKTRNDLLNRILYSGIAVPCYNGFIVVQRNINGGHFFNRDWKSFKYGFGSNAGSFWLGLEKLHILTRRMNCQLLVLFQPQFKGQYAYYRNFSVDGESNKYRLHVSGFSGNSTDGLTFAHNNMFFSTKDRDNDKLDTTNCANFFGGGWWYNDCIKSNLNGFNNRLVWDRVVISYSTMLLDCL